VNSTKPREHRPRGRDPAQGNDEMIDDFEVIALGILPMTSPSAPMVR
jgi:hypothetical protein